VYDERQRRVEKVCQEFNVALATSNNTFEDTYNKITNNDSGENSAREG
jgi:hypothetical protein